MSPDSQLTSLAELAEKSPAWRFNVPIYQRLYVWGDEQVGTLLSDLANAFERDAPLFFLGGTLLVEKPAPHGKVFDLIDGQQRFTTLWLLCQVWTRVLRESESLQKHHSPLQPFITVKVGDIVEPRLRFAIRPEINRYLEQLALSTGGLSAADQESTLRLRTAMDLMHSLFAKRTMPAGFKSREEYLAGLAEFVYTKVKFVVTTVPPETDLNKLFEVINNRGVQLQHHEILKARMLDALAESERGPFAVLWEACADMENFVDRALRGIANIPADEIADLHQRVELANAAVIRQKVSSRLQHEQESKPLDLASILNTANEIKVTKEEQTAEEEPPLWVNSIIGFPLFLQHVLRIWLYEHKREDLPRLLDRELLHLFEEHFLKDESNRRENVRSFIDLLWNVRVLFDEHIIKWVDQGEIKVHLICQISISPSNGKNYMNRARSAESHRGFSLLQSMLYHSQEITTHYWLTPLLYFMLKNPATTQQKMADIYFQYLRHLDDHLLCSDEKELLVIRTRKFMENPLRCCNLIYATELTKPEGVRFAHYWFYKLEFVLWFLRGNDSELWNQFRLTAKSSVEHIYPQNPDQPDDKPAFKALHHFGNLALVSRNLNSEYSNLPFRVKREKFKEKNKVRMDSLKMDLIYRNEHWSEDIAMQHQDNMIRIMDEYYGRTNEQSRKIQSNDTDH
jgi:hypothetical protein